MIKIGDKAKGLRFDNTYGINYNTRMDRCVGVEGIVKLIRPEINEIYIEFEFYKNTETHIKYIWCYPLDEYLRSQREERLKEIGI